MKGLAVVFILSTLGALGNGKLPLAQKQQAGGSMANQYFCELGKKYNPSTDACEPVFEKKDGAKNQARYFVSDHEVSMHVVKRAVAKKGDGCITITRDSMSPLSLSACENLAGRNGRMFSRGNLLIERGETWYLVEIKEGNITYFDWKIPSSKTTDPA